MNKTYNIFGERRWPKVMGQCEWSTVSFRHFDNWDWHHTNI